MKYCLTTILLLLVAAFCAADSSAATSQPPATKPSSSETGDILGEIDAMPSTSAATKPADRVTPSVPEQNDSSSTLAARIHYWWNLILFFTPGLAVGASIGIAGGIIGTFVLLRREALLALALPQIVAVGAAAGLRLALPYTLPPALVAACAGLAWIIWSRHRESAGRGTGAAIPALYISGLSISFLIIAGGGAHVEELQALFTGIDVAVTREQAAMVAPILLIAGLTAGVLWRRWLLLAQSPAAAQLAGLHPARWDAIFLSLLTLILLLGTNAQGVVMVLAMLFLPAASVLPWARRIPVALVSAAALAVTFLAVAFVLSTQMEWPLSQCVGGVGFIAFVMSSIAARVARR